MIICQSNHNFNLNWEYKENNMTNKEEKIIEQKIREYGKESQLNGMRAGATGILGAVLNMCNEGKTINDIKEFCEMSLGLEGMKK